MVRITVGGPDLGDFDSSGTDSHIVLYFYPEGAVLPDPLTAETARSSFSALRPVMRSYTIRRHIPDLAQLEIDFVLHDEPGPASAWAVSAQPGDEIIFVGPSPAYEPNVAAEQFLLIGDHSALPAIESILREIPTDKRIDAVIAISAESEKQELPANLHWVIGEESASAKGIIEQLAVIELSPDVLDVWIAGEKSAMQEVRQYLLDDRNLHRMKVRPATYWKLGLPS
jgi:NADPH-dependent ferric siderophore reductase